MKQDVRSIEIKEGVVYVSHLEKPVKGKYTAIAFIPGIHPFAQVHPDYDSALLAYQGSLVRVENPEYLAALVVVQSDKLKDGHYLPQDGLQMEVKKIGEECGHSCNDYKDICQYSGCNNFRKVAFCTFSEPPEEKEDLNKAFCEGDLLYIEPKIGQPPVTLQQTAEGIDEIIARIEINPGNLKYIADKHKINGSLLVSIRSAMQEFASQASQQAREGAIQSGRDEVTNIVCKYLANVGLSHPENVKAMLEELEKLKKV